MQAVGRVEGEGGGGGQGEGEGPCRGHVSHPRVIVSRTCLRFIHGSDLFVIFDSCGVWLLQALPLGVGTDGDPFKVTKSMKSCTSSCALHQNIPIFGKIISNTTVIV